MALPALIPLIAAAIPELVRAGTGIAQGIKAKKLLKNTVRPTYKTPDDVIEARNRARLAASSPYLPGQTRTEENIGLAGANAVGNSKELGNRDVSDIYGKQIQALGDVGIAAAGNKMQRDQGLTNTLMRTGQFQDQEFQLNKMNPYNEAIKTTHDLKNSSTTNLFESTKNLAAIGIKGMQMKKGLENQDALDALSRRGVGTEGAPGIATPNNTAEVETILTNASAEFPGTSKARMMMYLQGQLTFDNLTEVEKALIESKGLKDYSQRIRL